MRLTGQLLRLEPRSGTMIGRDGAPFNWANTVAHVLDGVEVRRVKVKGEDVLGFKPKVGDQVDLEVNVEASTGREGPYLSLTFVPAMADAGKGKDNAF